MFPKFLALSSAWPKSMGTADFMVKDLFKFTCASSLAGDVHAMAKRGRHEARTGGSSSSDGRTRSHGGHRHSRHGHHSSYDSRQRQRLCCSPRALSRRCVSSRWWGFKQTLTNFVINKTIREFTCFFNEFANKSCLAEFFRVVVVLKD